MNVLFIHQNFPGQYLHLVRHMERTGRYRIVGLGEAENIKRRGLVQGIATVGYPSPKAAGAGTHPYLKSTEAAVRRGQAVARLLLELKAKGFLPDVVSVHPGWGEALFIRDIYPDLPILMFCEYYFRAGEADIGFDPEFAESADWNFSVRIRNTPQVMSLLTADACLCPTSWQASRYPDVLRHKMRIIHDGVNTDFMTPDPSDSLALRPRSTPGQSRVVPAGERPLTFGGEATRPLVLSRDDKVVTFVARNLEPYRGYHVFMRSLPAIQKAFPDASVLIVGNDGVGYSPKLDSTAGSYRDKYLDEVRDALDLSRVHFLGRVPYPALRAVFRISSAHVYLTYPFVLSWSVLECMACEGLVVASDTAPVREVIRHGENGLLVDFFDERGLVDALKLALERPEDCRNMRANARRTVLESFALDACLQKHVALLDELAESRVELAESRVEQVGRRVELAESRVEQAGRRIEQAGSRVELAWPGEGS